MQTMGESLGYITALSCGHYRLIQHLRLQKEHIVSSNPSQISSEKIAAHLGIHFYERRNGVNIPLIPADQLPFYIEGVSWPLSDRQTAMDR
jgi:hypothetical protein